jgi:hypothetical protein
VSARLPLLPLLLLHESHEKIKTLHWVRRTGVQKEIKIFAREEALPLEASSHAAGCTEMHYRVHGISLAGEAERGHGRDRTARDAKGNVLHGGHMILAPSFGHGVLRSYTHNGPFFFLGSSGGMSYLVSTSSSIEFHPFDPKGMAGFNT